MLFSLTSLFILCFFSWPALEKMSSALFSMKFLAVAPFLPIGEVIVESTSLDLLLALLICFMEETRERVSGAGVPDTNVLGLDLLPRVWLKFYVSTKELRLSIWFLALFIKLSE